MLKVGDKVKIIKDLNEPNHKKVFPIGTEGVITECHSFGYDYPFQVCSNGKCWWYPSEALELLESSKSS